MTMIMMLTRSVSCALLLLLNGAMAQDGGEQPQVPEIPEGVDVCEDLPGSIIGDLAPYKYTAANAFCMNDGTCKPTYQETPRDPCNCPDGLTGPHCEFEVGQVPECTLNCFHGGECQPGIQSYTQTSFLSNQDLQYCICKDGYYGLLCEIEARPCGEHHCFNGGTCVVAKREDGTMQEYCDCTAATDNATAYAGRYCQSQSTSFCSRFPDHNGKSFCTNGGSCKGDSHLGCNCLDGFVGPVCEFTDNEIEHSECTLQCQNNGICRKGAKDISILKKFGVNRLDLNKTYNEDFEHCVCPKGYVGLHCEHEMDICPGGQHVCMHGSECVPIRTNSGLHFECDCNAIRDPFHKYAGKYCEYESTDFCTADGKKPHKGPNHGAFCVNNGSCKGHVGKDKEHPGCKCESGFAGRHCELVAGSRSRSSDDSNSNKGYIIGLSVGVAVLAVVLAISIMRSRRRRRQLFEMPPYIVEYSDKVPEAAPAPTIDHINGANLSPFSDHPNMDGEISEVEGEDDHSAPSNTPSGTSNGAKSDGSPTFAEDKQTGVASLMKEEPSNTSPADMPMDVNTPEGSEVTVFHDGGSPHLYNV